MYNTYDKPTQLMHREHPKCCGCCHHDCLNGCVCVPNGTRPFVQCLRPELGPWNAQVPWCGAGSTSGNPRTQRMRTHTQMTRQSWAWLGFGASPGNAVQNRIMTQIRMRHFLIRMEQHSTQLYKIKLISNEHILHIKMLSES